MWKMSCRIAVLCCTRPVVFLNLTVKTRQVRLIQDKWQHTVLIFTKTFSTQPPEITGKSSSQIQSLCSEQFHQLLIHQTVFNSHTWLRSLFKIPFLPPLAGKLRGVCVCACVCVSVCLCLVCWSLRQCFFSDNHGRVGGPLTNKERDLAAIPLLLLFPSPGIRESRLIAITHGLWLFLCCFSANPACFRGNFLANCKYFEKRTHFTPN